MLIHTYEDLIYGETNVSPIRKTLRRALLLSSDEEQRLRIEIRSQPEGSSRGSQQKHCFVVDPEQTTPRKIMRLLVELLEESPGKGFRGQIRINFSQAGSSGERYGSFTRTIPGPSNRPNTPHAPPSTTTHIHLKSTNIEEAVLMLIELLNSGSGITISGQVQLDISSNDANEES